jgi:hypothetical protein
MENLFIRASKAKLRFKMSKGNISTEDLWDLNLEALDELAKALNKEVKDAREGSFIKKKSVSNTALNLRFDIVKFVIEEKLKEDEEKEERAVKRARKETLLGIIERKEAASMEGKSIEELKSELLALG